MPKTKSKNEDHPLMPQPRWKDAAPKAKLDKPNKKGRDLTIEDLYAWELPEKPRVSPDGSKIVYATLSIDKDADEYRSTLWLIDGASEPRKLTSGQWSDTSPQWSPDGTRIAFLSNRHEKKTQIFVMPVDGGESEKLTAMDDGVAKFVWSPDSQRIAFFPARAPKKREDEAVKVYTSARYKFDGAGFVDPMLHHICMIGVEGGEPQQLTEKLLPRMNLAFSPNGDQIAYVSNQEDDYDLRREFDIYVMDIASKKEHRLTDGKGSWGHPTYSPDGEMLAIVGNEDAYAEDVNSYLYILPAAGGEPERLGKRLDRAIGDTGMSGPAANSGDPVRWTSNGKAIDAIVSDRGDTCVVRFNLKSKKPICLTPAGRHVKSFDHQGDDLVIASAQPARPVELSRITAEGEDRLTHHNDAWVNEVYIPQPQEFWYESDGELVQGWLIRPRGNTRKSTDKVPLMLNIHGGPHAQFTPSFFHELQMFVSKGWALVFVNPRGSTGRSNKFGKAVQSRWGFADMPDFMAAIDHVLALGGLDKKRLGVTGGSYGGFSTNWLIGHTDRFKAAVTDRTISNMTSMYGTDDISLTFADLGLGTPWDNPKANWKASPLAYVKNVKTPCLIIHSEEDHRCPMEQGEQWFIALKSLGVPTEFVRYPNSSHGLGRTGKPTYRVDRLERTLGWFEKYL